MKFLSLILTAILVIIPISTFSASIGLIEELSFTVPKLQGVILDIDFNDINGDSIPEVLACDSYIWVLYSMTSDSVISWDSLVVLPVTGTNVFTKLLLDDVNNDSICDIVIARQTIAPGSLVNGDSTANLIQYDGSLGFQMTSSVFFNSARCIYNCRVGGIGVLRPIDLKKDGTKELFCSFSTIGFSSCCENSGGKTYIFESFPDSFTVQNNLYLSYHPMNALSDGFSFLTETFSYSFFAIGGDRSETNQDIGYVDSAGVFHAYLIDSTRLPCPIYPGGNFAEFYETIAATGNIYSSNSYEEFLMVRTSQIVCVDVYVISDSSLTDLTLFEVKSADSIAELWTVANIQGRWTNFVYLPQFPGFFCAFVDEVFTQFDGSDGSVFQATAAVPTGKREWAYPLSDSIPRLIVKNGTSVSFYLTDISTPVYENDPPTLPDDFRLSQPYPNPFNPQVNLSLFIPRRSEVVVKVFNIVGQQVDVLYNDVASAGELKLQWNAKDNPSGIYLIKAISGAKSSTVKAVLLK